MIFGDLSQLHMGPSNTHRSRTAPNEGTIKYKIEGRKQRASGLPQLSRRSYPQFQVFPIPNMHSKADRNNSGRGRSRSYSPKLRLKSKDNHIKTFAVLKPDIDENLIASMDAPESDDEDETECWLCRKLAGRKSC